MLCSVTVVIKDTPSMRLLYGSANWQIVESAKTYMWTIKSRNDREATHLMITSYEPVRASVPARAGDPSGDKAPFRGDVRDSSEATLTSARASDIFAEAHSAVRQTPSIASRWTTWGSTKTPKLLSRRLSRRWVRPQIGMKQPHDSTLSIDSYLNASAGSGRTVPQKSSLRGPTVTTS
jgi:hypothetical protein